MIGMKTNGRLQRDVLDDLRNYARADLDEISVNATDGIVTLAGTVKSHAEKWSIVHAAERVAAVKAIVNRIQVESRKDEEIARAVLDRLRAYGTLDAFQGDGYKLDDTIKIHVERGWIIVKGTVASKQLRTRIEDIVRSVAGVRGVSNHLRTKAVVATREKTFFASSGETARNSIFLLAEDSFF